jgi:LacI family transcriptional regulator
MDTMTDETTENTLDSPETGRRRKGASPVDRASKPVSLRDVARMANVSVATVSMVLNDNPRISRATHMKVQRLIERMGYQPNRLAQSLSSRYTKCFAVIVPALRHTFADVYFGELISGICDRASKLGYKVMIEQAKPEFIEERKHIEIFERRYVDGVCILGSNDNQAWIEDFRKGPYPAMVVDNYFEQWGSDYTVCDYKSGATQVMNYLLQLGHKNIAMLTAAPEIRTARDVVEVYKARLADSGVKVNPGWIVDGEFTEEGGVRAMDQLLDAHPELTAVFAANDKMAIGALHSLRRRNIKVPQEFSVIGFDNLQHAAFVSPSLTTVHLPLYQVGALACERLLDRVKGRAEPVTEVLSTHLIVRESTAMARN